MIAALTKAWGRHFLRFELGVSIGLTITYLVWFYRFGGDSWVSRLMPDTRNDFYGTASSIYGALLGFALTATSVVLSSASDKRLEFLRKTDQYPTLWNVFMATLRWLAAATVWSVLCLVLDTGTRASGILTSGFVLMLLASACRFGRTVWVFQKIIDLLTGPARRAAPTPPSARSAPTSSGMS